MYKIIPTATINAADFIKEIGVDGVFVHPRSAIAAGTSLDVAKGLCKYITSSKEEEMHEWVSENCLALCTSIVLT